MKFESNDFNIPDLTESEIATFFTDEGEMEALASPMDLRPAGYRNSKVKDMAASLVVHYFTQRSGPDQIHTLFSGTDWMN